MTEAAATDTTTDDGWEWAVVEIFGHRRHVGKTREVERYGAKMIRVDEPTITDGAVNFDSATWTSHFYGGGAIFSVQPTDEATALRIAARHYVRPAIPYRASDYNFDERDGDGTDQRDYEHG